MKYIFYFLLIFVFSCGDDPLSPEEIAAQALLDDPRPKLLMTMSSDLEMTITLQKFEETVSYMALEIVFNHEALEITSYSKGIFGDPWSNMDYMDVNNDSVYCSFVFTSEMSNSGDLLNLTFKGKSSSSYQNSTIYISSILLEDANGDKIEFNDDNPLYLQDVCYINGYNSGGEWNDYGSYVWSNSFCWPLNYVP
jgi:hypothetical protein